MSEIDHKWVRIYALAQDTLAEHGYTNTLDIAKLSDRLADTVQDFIADLENEEDK